MVLSWPAIASADGDHDRARAAREAGEIASLETILARMRQEFAGTVLEVELETERGRWIYELKLLAPSGAVVKLEYDARDGRLLRTKGNAEAARRKP